MGSVKKNQGGFDALDDPSAQSLLNQARTIAESKGINSRDMIVWAFRTLIQTIGPNAEQFVNIDEFWQRDDYIDYWRKQLEKYISATYLPGFEFESNKHFTWHFQERDDPFILLRGRSTETHLETWLRAIMVPRSVHYRSEVADALYRWEQRNRPRLKRKERWDKSWSWKCRVEKVFRLASLESGGESSSEVESRSVQRWRSGAENWREERRGSNPPSGWCIECIEFEGDEEIRQGFEEEHYDLPEHLRGPEYYRETWKWKSIEGRPAPLCDSITFGKPAISALWKKSWKDKKAKG